MIDPISTLIVCCSVGLGYCFLRWCDHDDAKYERELRESIERSHYLRIKRVGPWARRVHGNAR